MRRKGKGMSEYVNYSACDLDDLIESTYGKRFEIPCFMEGQRLLEVYGPCVLSNDDQNWADDQIHEWKKGAPNDIEKLEAIMCDLCAKNLLEAGDYLLEFDD